MTKQAKVEIRCSDEEKARWQKAAGGPRKVSAWLRTLANAAAHAGTAEDAIETLVTEGSAVVIEKAKTPLSTSGMIRAGSSSGRTADSGSAGEGSTPSPAASKPKGQCPRWFHHRPGRYCGTCGKIPK